MNFIDIASYQSGIMLDVLFQNNPIDGVIVKTTGGTGYVNPFASDWLEWLIQNNKPFGFYHFLEDGYGQTSGTQEADFFIDNSWKYFGKGIPFVDWEGAALKFGTQYPIDFLKRVKDKTGYTCGIYMSRSRISRDFLQVTDCPLWVAQYADYNVVDGFVEDPWKNGSVSPWAQETLRQYTSSGKLAGYAGRLDFDKFYGNLNDWNRLVGITDKIDVQEIIKLLQEAMKLLQEMEAENGK